MTNRLTTKVIQDLEDKLRSENEETMRAVQELTECVDSLLETVRARAGSTGKLSRINGALGSRAMRENEQDTIVGS